MLVLIGVAAAFRTAFLPHTTKPSVASKLAQTNHPVAVVPPQWLPMLLAANSPGPPTSHRRRSEFTPITSKTELKTAVREYNTNVTAEEAKYGSINDWNVSGIRNQGRSKLAFKNLTRPCDTPQDYKPHCSARYRDKWAPGANKWVANMTRGPTMCGLNVSFAVVGVQKGGTTALRHFMNNNQPGLCVPVGEWDKFETTCETLAATTRLVETTVRKNANTSCAVGFVSPSILMGAALRPEVQRLNPQLRLVVLLREPMQRAYSVFQMVNSWSRVPGYKKTPFTSVVATLHASMHRTLQQRDWSGVPQAEWLNLLVTKQHASSALGAGIYQPILVEMARVHTRARMHIAISERVRANTTAEYARIFDFLGIGPLAHQPPSSGEDARENHDYKKTGHATLTNASLIVMWDLFQPLNELLYAFLDERIVEWEQWYTMHQVDGLDGARQTGALGVVNAHDACRLAQRGVTAWGQNLSTLGVLGKALHRACCSFYPSPGPGGAPRGLPVCLT